MLKESKYFVYKGGGIIFIKIIIIINHKKLEIKTWI